GAVNSVPGPLFTGTPLTAAPVFTSGTGTYSAGQQVTLASGTSGASIRYTTDGSTPTSSVGILYVGPITIHTTTTIKAIAYATGLPTARSLRRLTRSPAAAGLPPEAHRDTRVVM